MRPERDTEDYYQRLGERIRRERVVRDVSQVTLGDVVALKASSICLIEKGKRTLRVDQLDRIAAFLGVDIASFVKKEELER